MKNLVFVLGLFLAVTGCGRDESKPASPMAATGDGNQAASPAAAPANAPAPAPAESAAAVPDEAQPAAEEKPAFREVTIPAGTTLRLTLQTTVASETSNVEDPVRATLQRPVTVEGVQALPEKTTFIGHVTEAERSGRVKGVARIAFRFTRADLPGDGGQVDVRTATVSRVAEATKKRDAATIGGGAVGGAVVGGILGGGSGAKKGALIGGAGGTGVVLATRGKEVSLPSGTAVSVKLTAPVTVRVEEK